MSEANKTDRDAQWVTELVLATVVDGINQFVREYLATRGLLDMKAYLEAGLHEEKHRIAKQLGTRCVECLNEEGVLAVDD